MIVFFNKLYSSITNRNFFLERIKFHSALRLLIRSSANFILPLYFKVTQNNPKYSLIQQQSLSTERIIVSLTTFPARINKVWLVIETLLRQKKRPDKIVLWLSNKEYQSINNIPLNLRKQIKRGLTIEFIDDLRSHTKYYYAFQKYPNDYIITVDDDIFYNTNLIDNLFQYSLLYKNHTIANICRKVEYRNKLIKSYSDWHICTETSISKLICGLGVGGILYPPHSLHKLCLHKEDFLKNCPLADDIWLYFMTIINNNTCINISQQVTTLLPIMIFNTPKLTNINNGLQQNDIQIQTMIKYCIQKIGYDPLSRE